MVELYFILNPSPYPNHDRLRQLWESSYVGIALSIILPELTTSAKFY